MNKVHTLGSTTGKGITGTWGIACMIMIWMHDDL